MAWRKIHVFSNIIIKYILSIKFCNTKKGFDDSTQHSTHFKKRWRSGIVSVLLCF